ncbi:unnamed protein product [Ectocarpus fasciculatus]
MENVHEMFHLSAGDRCFAQYMIFVGIESWLLYLKVPGLIRSLEARPTTSFQNNDEPGGGQQRTRLPLPFHFLPQQRFSDNSPPSRKNRDRRLLSLWLRHHLEATIIVLGAQYTIFYSA